MCELAVTQRASETVQQACVNISHSKAVIYTAAVSLCYSVTCVYSTVKVILLCTVALPVRSHHISVSVTCMFLAPPTWQVHL